jgi:hypothetical protein
LKDRLSDYDYRHQGYSYGRHQILAERADRLSVLDLERRSQQAMASHLKYDGGGRHHVPSLGYDKPVYYLYIAWVDPSSVGFQPPKEGWFAPEAGHEDLARYGGLDVAVAFIERRLGG